MTKKNFYYFLAFLAFLACLAVIFGEVRERFKRRAWKARRLERVSRVRIPPSPQYATDFKTGPRGVRLGVRQQMKDD